MIANSHAGARATAQRTRAPQAKFATVANGVGVPASIGDDERVRIRCSLGVPDGRAFGLFVGRLVTVKNLPCLIRALATMPPGTRPWIALAGDGPLRTAIERLAADQGLAADLAFLGERSDASSLFRIVQSENDDRLRDTAIVTLGRVGGRQQLRSLLARASKETRLAVVRGLFLAGDDDGLIRVAEQEKDPEVRSEVLSRLRLIGTPKAKAYLESVK